ncbi:MAG TPA: hypothetical protein VHA06_24040 [Candidatus Angelobacter sp.]|nr:hypothetical protein [Candidatus Angelobacter sp.]
MITSGSTTFLFGDDAVLITSSVAGTCTCSRSAFLFVSRNGRTRCLECAHFLILETDAADDAATVQDAFEKTIV